MSATARRRRSSRGARMSMENRARPGMTLTAPGSTSSRPTVATSSSSVARSSLDAQDHFGGRGERVVAQVHRHGAGVAGHSAHGDVEARRAVDRADDAEGQALGFEHRPLFDMQLDEGGHAARARRRQPIGIAAERLQRVAHDDSLGVPLVERALLRPARRVRASRSSSWESGRPLRRRKRRSRSRRRGVRLAAASSSTTASAASAPRLPS